MNPKICVLIPVFNEEKVLAGTIIELRKSGFDSSDIYVVDDKSTDRTADIAQRQLINFMTVKQNGGKAVAQIEAIKHFKLTDRYDWIVLLDGDTKVDIGFRSALIQALKDEPGYDLYVGQVSSAKNNHIFSALRAYDYTFGQEIIKKGQDNFKVIFVSPGCASMYNASVLKQLRIEPDTLAEDMDLTIQLHRIGGKVKYIPNALVITQDPGSLRDYHKQIMRWYRGFWQVILKHKIFSPFQRKQRVDVYMMYLAMSAILFNHIFMLGIATTVAPIGTILKFALIDILIYCLIGCWVSLRTRRLDVLIKMPIFYWLSFLNLYAFLRSFVEIVVFRKEILAWNKVKRYKFETVKP